MSDVSCIRVYDDGSPISKNIISFLRDEGVSFTVVKSYDFRVEIGLVAFRDMGELQWVLRNGGYIKKTYCR